MINIPAATNAFIIGHTPVLPFTSLSAIRAPEFLPQPIADALFANNWPYWLAAALIGAAAFYVGRSRGNRNALRAAVAIFAATSLWIFLALLIVTPQERLEAAHRAFINAAAEKNVDGILAVFTDDFQLPALNITPAGRRITIEYALKNFPIRANYIVSMNTRLKSGTATTTVVILSEFESLPPARTKWEFRWVDLPNADWRLRFADLISVNDTENVKFILPSQAP